MIERKYITADVLFRHLYTMSDNVNKKFKENIDDFLNAELNVIRIAFIWVRSKSSED